VVVVAVDVPWTSFAAVCVRGEVFEGVGLLDEKFFMYYEDVEFCRRVRRKGWRIRHEPVARVVHLRGKSSPVKKCTEERLRRPRYFYSSRKTYYRRAYGPAGPLVANLFWTLGYAVSRCREIFGKKPPHCVESELFDNWRG
jgi:GT2 family glycosyltransferase